MPTATERLRTVRLLYRRRGDGRSAGDIAYAVYAGLLVATIAGTPVLRAVTLALTQPAALEALRSPTAGRVVGIVCGAVLAGLAAMGAVRGPAVVPPFFVMALAGNDLSRGRTLLRPHCMATFVLTMLLTGVAGLLSTVLVTSGAASVQAGIGFAVAMVAVGLLGGTVWLAGQRLGRGAWVLTTALLGATLLTWAVPVVGRAFPWGWAGLAWAPGTTTAWPTVLLLGAALAATASAPRLLDGLSGPALLDQAHRWQAAGIATVAGDVAGALATYRARPRIGRSWPAVVALHTVPRFAVRDLVATLRTPGRLIAGTVSLLVGCIVISLASVVPDGVAWVPAVTGSALGYLGLGVLGDGFRHAADAAGAPPLYGYSTARLYGLHAVLPLAWAATCAGLGTAAATLVGAPLSSILTVGLIAVLLVAVRAYDSAKGPLSPALLAPVSTPAGDASGLIVAVWQADALLIAATAGAAVVLAAQTGSALGATTVAVVAGSVLLAMTWRRLRRL